MAFEACAWLLPTYQGAFTNLLVRWRWASCAICWLLFTTHSHANEDVLFFVFADTIVVSRLCDKDKSTLHTCHGMRAQLLENH